jgi:CBS domain-containing protein
MRCRDVMRREVVSLAPDETVETAARRMRDEEVGFLPVLDADGRPLGTLTDRELALRIVGERRPPETPVRDIMSLELATCRPADDTRDAEALMREHGTSHVLCTDARGRLKGVLGQRDIEEAHLRGTRVAYGDDARTPRTVH